MPVRTLLLHNPGICHHPKDGGLQGVSFIVVTTDSAVTDSLSFRKRSPGMVVHCCGPSTQEAEPGRIAARSKFA